jgi:hypothetical protein
MPDDAQQLVTLVMEGADEHHGHVMARALVEKLDRFLTTFWSAPLRVDKIRPLL